MNTHADKTQENKSRSVANAVSQKQISGDPTFQFVDNRPEAIAQRKLQEMANNSPRALKLKAFQEMADNSPQAKQAAQLQAMANSSSILTNMDLKKDVVQLATDPISYTNEPPESFAQVVEDAKLISRSQTGGGPLVEISGGEKLKDLKPEFKKILHVVAHGNREQVGDFNDETLNAHLDGFRTYPTDFMKIVLHSCESGIIDDREGKPTSGTSFAQRLAGRQTFPGEGHEAPMKSVIGMKGNVVTDSEGNSRVLIGPEVEKDYKEIRDRALRRGSQVEIKAAEKKYLKPLDETYDVQEKTPWD